jgi:hypothetical protein
MVLSSSYLQPFVQPRRRRVVSGMAWITNAVSSGSIKKITSMNRPPAPRPITNHFFWVDFPWKPPMGGPNDQFYFFDGATMLCRVLQIPGKPSK